MAQLQRTLAEVKDENLVLQLDIKKLREQSFSNQAIPHSDVIFNQSKLVPFIYGREKPALVGT